MIGSCACLLLLNSNAQANKRVKIELNDIRCRTQR